MSASGRPAHPAGEQISALQAEARAVLDPLLAGVRRTALLDLPTHRNPGDHAIALGELAYLRAAGVRVAYASPIEGYDADALRRLAPDGPLLLQGGGNLGDLWEPMQLFREQVLRDFPERRIIVLPQSIHFEREASLRRAAAAMGAHQDLTLLVRDRQSLKLAEEGLGLPARMCPDMALLIGPLRRPDEPVDETFALLRADKEGRPAALERAALAGLPASDWRPRRSRWRRAARTLRALPLGAGRLDAARHAALALCYRRLAAHHLREACRQLSRGRRVVTDRLHGHILCLLLGIPHALVDNSYGKVRAFYETWTRGCPLVTWQPSPDPATSTPGTGAACEP